MSKRLFISADIEGTCGIAHWDEANRTSPDYPHFARQMSLEVAAACEGALEAGWDAILIKDAHGSARNIDPSLLPEQAEIFRGWGNGPLRMMHGVNEDCDGVVFTGYHSAAQVAGNPLSHTTNRRNNYVKLNGELASEMLINSYTAAYFGLPVYALTGDKALCESMLRLSPQTLVVPVCEGNGNGSRSIHPALAVRRIRETVREALSRAEAPAPLKLPEKNVVEINYREHFDAARAACYPGVTQLDARTIRFETSDFFEALRTLLFVL